MIGLRERVGIAERGAESERGASRVVALNAKRREAERVTACEEEARGKYEGIVSSLSREVEEARRQAARADRKYEQLQVELTNQFEKSTLDFELKMMEKYENAIAKQQQQQQRPQKQGQRHLAGVQPTASFASSPPPPATSLPLLRRRQSTANPNTSRRT